MDRVVLYLDRYYFCCCAGIGDTMMICAMIQAVEKKLQGQIVLLIKESHQFLMEMYGISLYHVVDIENINSDYKGKKIHYPQKGKIYMAHPCAHNELKKFFHPIRDHFSTKPFLPWFKEFLGLEEDVQLAQPLLKPKLSKQLRSKLEVIAPMDKIVLFSHEATSVLPLNPVFWTDLAAELAEAGFEIICNVHKAKNTISGTHYLGLSLYDAVALAFECHSVYSIRSGFCDPLYQLGNKLNVFYSSHETYFIYSLNKMFNKKDIVERIVIG